jgi:hypothetical protein
MLVCMRTTLILDPQLVERANQLTGIQENAALVHAGLEALIAREAGKRLAALGRTQPM